MGLSFSSKAEKTKMEMNSKLFDIEYETNNCIRELANLKMKITQTRKINKDKNALVILVRKQLQCEKKMSNLNAAHTKLSDIVIKIDDLANADSINKYINDYNSILTRFNIRNNVQSITNKGAAIDVKEGEADITKETLFETSAINDSEISSRIDEIVKEYDIDELPSINNTVQMKSEVYHPTSNTLAQYM